MVVVKPKRVKKVAHDWHEGAVLDALESEYPDKSKGVFLRGVRDATSFDQSRTADGLYMGCWKSVGVHLHGFEVKVSRSDWLREIQDVSKAACFEKYCHYWWVVAPDGCVELAEMPSQWGLKIVSKNENGTYSVRAKKAATLNVTAQLDFKFFASCMRTARRDGPTEQERRQIHDDAFEKGRESERKQSSEHYELRHLKASHETLEAIVKDFEAASGVRIRDPWGNKGRKIGAAVKQVLEHGIGCSQQLEWIINQCNSVATELQKIIDEEKASNPLAGQEVDSDDARDV